MTFGTTALWLGSTTHTTRVARNATAGAYGAPFATFAGGISPTTAGGAHGVVGQDDLLVTVTTGLGFSVATGRAVVLGGSAAAQGAYHGIYNDAPLVSAVGAHHATLPRKDLICVRVRDTDEDASGSEDCGLVVIAGTAAGSPADPTVPANHLVLARANVPATSGNITLNDLRQYVSAVGGIQRCTSTTRPTGVARWIGKFIHESHTLRFWDSSAWRRASPLTTLTGTTVAGDLQIEAGKDQVLLTDATGVATMTFTNAFGTNPIVTAIYSDAGSDIRIVIAGTGTTGFTAKFRHPDGSNVATTFVQFSWIAIGYAVAATS